MRLPTCAILLLSSAASAQAAGLQIQFAAEIFQGRPTFEVLTDGELLGAGEVPEAGMTFDADVPSGAKEISVRFTNDAAAPSEPGSIRAPGSDRNLIIQSVMFAGAALPVADFKGQGKTTRGSELVLYSNTEVTLALPPQDVASDAADPAPALVHNANAVQVEAAPAAALAAECGASSQLTDYANGSVAMNAEQRAALAPILESNDCALVITGYSSTAGSEEANARIALERAQAVGAYLSSVNASFASVEIIGAGETTQFGASQSANRRVVLELR